MVRADVEALLEQINEYAHQQYMTGVNQGKADAAPYEQDRAAYQHASDERGKLAAQAIQDIMARLGR